MQLVKKERLQFQDAKSDKVYEVELYYIQEEEYVVNFRYGKRGSTLREGTKTVFPVTQERAEKVYVDLINSKVAKGYKKVQEYVEEPLQGPSAPVMGDNPASKVVLSYLKLRASGGLLTTNWKLSRIIWRAGELNLAAAVPYIGDLLPSLQGQEIYSAVWTLGRIADKVSLRILKSMAVHHEDLHYNIYIGARINAGDTSVKSDIFNRLPSLIAKGIEQKSTTNLIAGITQMRDTEDAAYLLDIYYLLFDNEPLRLAFTSILREVPMIPGKWKYLRYIYKVAEMVEDGDTFGMIASRVNLRSAYFKSQWTTAYVNGQSYNIKEALSGKSPKLAFSNKTKNYFVTRTLRRLKKAGVDKQESYCKFASGILLAYDATDERDHPNQVNYFYDSVARRYNSNTRTFPRMAHVPYFYYILFAQGDNYQITKKTSKFYNSAVESNSEAREDSFSELWNRYPKYTAKILIRCRQSDAMRFALKVLKGRTDIDDLFSLDNLVAMVTSPFEEVLEFSLAIIRRKYDPQNPNFNLINALIATENEKAVALAIELIKKYSELFTKNLSFIKNALDSKNEAIHNWIRLNIKEIDFTESELDEVVEHVIATMTAQEQRPIDTAATINSEEGQEPQEAQENASEGFNTLPPETLVQIFPEYLKTTESEKIISLIENDLLPVQLFGAKLINLNHRRPEEWPESIIMSLLTSPYPEIRDEGMKLYSKLTDKQLSETTELIISLASSEHSDLRVQARTIIARIAPNNKGFSESVLYGLYNTLLDDHEDEALPKDVYETIEQHLMPVLPILEKELPEMLQSNNREIHLLTYEYIKNHGDLNTWEIEAIARLGRHDMKKVREMATDYYENNIDKIRYSRLEAIGILDTDWKETRVHCQKYFDTHFSEAEWDPELIITLCDSIRSEVQQYGTNILGQYFREAHGTKYLTALSEHPDPIIQLYSTNYLDRFAFNDMAILDKLRPYFIRILHSINTRRVAKMRAFKFLEKQAQQGEAYAKYVIDILNELVGTIVVRENENYVSLLYELNKEYPDTTVKIESVPLEIR